MPILAPETDLSPADLLDRAAEPSSQGEGWWALYSLSRQEKMLMRKLRGLGVPFYSPMVAKRNRSPAGRVRVSQVPLFSNYVFMYGNEDHRQLALTTNCISRCLAAPHSA